MTKPSRQQHIQRFLNEVLQSERRLPPDVRAGFQRASYLMLDFVKHRGRLVYGGQAIHAALLAANLPGIYGPDHLMDIDIYSPDPIGDMIDACNALVDNGFRYIMGIGRIHPTTRSVKYDFMAESVLDITHVPETIYNGIPRFKDDQDIWYTSIEFQACDLYAALARNPARNFEARWEKDCARLAQIKPLLPDPIEITDLSGLVESPWFQAHKNETNWFFMTSSVIFSTTLPLGEKTFSRVLIDQIPKHTSLTLSSAHYDVFHHTEKLGGNDAEYLVYEYDLPNLPSGSEDKIRVATPFLQHWFLDRINALRKVLPKDFVQTFTPIIVNATALHGKPCARKLITATSTSPDPGVRMGPAWERVRNYMPQKKHLDSDYFGDSTIENISGEREH